MLAVGASAWIAHSKLSNVWLLPASTTWNDLSYSLPQTSHLAMVASYPDATTEAARMVHLREDRSRSVGEHLAAEHDVLVAAVLGEVVADAADRGNEEHGDGQAADTIPASWNAPLGMRCHFPGACCSAAAAMCSAGPASIRVGAIGARARLASIRTPPRA
jgi:hypothetical protein